jgi:oxalate decarboxylase/phosphoglucose isomerase-like protein (cupin superfamily)
MNYVARVQEIREWLRMEKARYYTGGDKRWLRDGLEWHRLIDPDVSDDLIFGVARLEMGQVHLLHHHDNAAELYYVLEGTGLFTLDDETIDGTPGTVIYISVGAKHRIENNGCQTLMFFFVYNQPHYTTILDEK